MSGVASRGYKQNGGFVPKARFVIAILQNKKLKIKKPTHAGTQKTTTTTTKNKTKTHTRKTKQKRVRKRWRMEKKGG